MLQRNNLIYIVLLISTTVSFQINASMETAPKLISNICWKLKLKSNKIQQVHFLPSSLQYKGNYTLNYFLLLYSLYFLIYLYKILLESWSVKYLLFEFFLSTKFCYIQVVCNITRDFSRKVHVFKEIILTCNRLLKRRTFKIFHQFLDKIKWVTIMHKVTKCYDKYAVFVKESAKGSGQRKFEKC